MLAGLARKLLRAGVLRVPGAGRTAEQAALDAAAVTPETVLKAYSAGYFPMALESGAMEWQNPARRAVMPIDAYRIPKNLHRLLRGKKFEIRLNTAFEAVLTACAERELSWITPPIKEAYLELDRMGLIHTVEAWKDGKLAGAVYGICIGRFYSGESSFFEVPDAGKIAMVHVLKALKASGFLLHDCQYLTGYLERYGAYEISREEYQHQLMGALFEPSTFDLPDAVINTVTDDPSEAACR